MRFSDLSGISVLEEGPIGSAGHIPGQEDIEQHGSKGGHDHGLAEKFE
jgi:hypothetical protein